MITKITDRNLQHNLNTLTLYHPENNMSYQDVLEENTSFSGITQPGKIYFWLPLSKHKKSTINKQKNQHRNDNSIPCKTMQFHAPQSNIEQKDNSGILKDVSVSTDQMRKQEFSSNGINKPVPFTLHCLVDQIQVQKPTPLAAKNQILITIKMHYKKLSTTKIFE